MERKEPASVGCTQSKIVDIPMPQMQRHPQLDPTQATTTAAIDMQGTASNFANCIEPSPMSAETRPVAHAAQPPSPSPSPSQLYSPSHDHLQPASCSGRMRKSSRRSGVHQAAVSYSRALSRVFVWLLLQRHVLLLLVPLLYFWGMLLMMQQQQQEGARSDVLGMIQSSSNYNSIPPLQEFISSGSDTQAPASSSSSSAWGLHSQGELQLSGISNTTLSMLDFLQVHPRGHMVAIILNWPQPAALI